MSLIYTFLDETTIQNLFEKLIRLQTYVDLKEDKHKISHILDILKMNPQLQLVLNGLNEKEGKLQDTIDLSF